MINPTAARRRRALLAFTAAGVAAMDLVIKAVAERRLRSPLDLGLIQLQLVHNPGVAFSVGQALPAWTVLALTASIALALLAYAWAVVPDSRPVARLALGVVLGGALGNLLDRASDGVVTDYLHTGWFPTFNLADTLIVVGAATLTLTHLAAHPGAGAEPAPKHPS